MIELLLKWLSFLIEKCPFLISLICMTGIFLLLAKSIRKQTKLYYIVFAIPAVLCILQEILTLVKIDIVNFYSIPIMGEVMRQYIHMAGFGYPLLVIIMYVGALNPKNPNVKKILSIRKELSIISGFPVLTHSIIRLMYNIPSTIEFFVSRNTYLEKSRWPVNSTLGAELTNIGYLLGILMVILFLVLWVTSFNSIHKRLGAKKWKRIQNWSYILYAMLFLHSALLNTGWMMDMGISGGNKDFLLSSALGLASTCLVFISYLILRLRKWKQDAHIGVTNIQL